MNTLVMKFFLSIFLSLLFATTSNAEVGDVCPPITLTQPLNQIKERLESFLPSKSWVISATTCVKDIDLVGANYSPICSIAPKLDVVIASAFGNKKIDHLSLLVLQIPYAAEIEKTIVANLNGVPISLTENAKRYSVNARKMQLFAIDNGMSHALLSEEMGIAALSKKDYFVIRVFPASDDGSLSKALQSCNQ
jgi:hypothetical protein